MEQGIDVSRYQGDIDWAQAAATLEQGLEEADAVLRELAAVGIDLPKVTERLLDEGIAKFIKAFDDVVETIAAKAQGAK